MAPSSRAILDLDRASRAGVCRGTSHVPPDVAPGTSFHRMTRRSYDRDSDGYSGVASLGTTILLFGATLEEARENLVDAVRMIREPIDLSKLLKNKGRDRTN